MQEYGYIRVSTKEQKEDRQLIAMEALRLPDDHIFIDKVSGKDFNRPQYKRLLRRIKKGDVIFVKSIDRLGRNYNEILQQWQWLTKEREVDIVVLDMPLLDTRSHKDLTGTLIADVVLQLLSYVAQTERENIRQRQREGIEAAMRRGVRFGRPEKIPPENFVSVYERWRAGEISGREAARQLQVVHRTFFKWARSQDEKNL